MSSTPPTELSLSKLVGSSTPHLLAYSIPVLLLSTLLTFAGTFLTLDRSRSFPSSYVPVNLPGALKKRPKFNWALCGGVGGLASGYLFGLHLSTFLALLVPATSTSAPLSSNSFLAVWILSCILTTGLGGRYKYCALIFSAISGGALSALAVSVAIHPSLLPRQVLTAFFSLLSLALVLVFSLPRLSRFLRPALRAATSACGAFGLVLAIALLAHIPAWADVWERLWVHDGETWGTSKEQGLSATFFLTMCGGFASDWMLNRWLGECPDEKWDQYLAEYTANLPNDASRAGTFKALEPKSLWARLFHPPTKKELFPLSPSSSYYQPRGSISKDAAALLSDDYDDNLIKSPTKAQYDFYDLPTPPGFLKKPRSQTMFRPPRKKKINDLPNTSGGRKHIKFGVPDLSSDESDSGLNADKVRPWLQQKRSTASASSSSPTLVDAHIKQFPHMLDYELEIAKLKKGKVKAIAGEGVPEYSDYEEDIGSPTKSIPRRGVGEGDAEWSPGFMKRHSASLSGSGISGSRSGSTNGSAPLAAVPATPSLIKALDRISVAQQDAFGAGVGGGRRGPPTQPWSAGAGAGRIYPPGKGKTKVDGMLQAEGLDIDDEDELKRAPRWEEFWKDVREKAGS